MALPPILSSGRENDPMGTNYFSQDRLASLRQQADAYRAANTIAAPAPAPAPTGTTQPSTGLFSATLRYPSAGAALSPTTTSGQINASRGLTTMQDAMSYAAANTENNGYASATGEVLVSPLQRIQQRVGSLSYDPLGKHGETIGILLASLNSASPEDYQSGRVGLWADQIEQLVRNNQHPDLIQEGSRQHRYLLQSGDPRAQDLAAWNASVLQGVPYVPGDASNRSGGGTATGGPTQVSPTLAGQPGGQPPAGAPGGAPTTPTSPAGTPAAGALQPVMRAFDPTAFTARLGSIGGAFGSALENAMLQRIQNLPTFDEAAFTNRFEQLRAGFGLDQMNAERDLRNRLAAGGRSASVGGGLFKGLADLETQYDAAQTQLLGQLLMQEQGRVDQLGLQTLGQGLDLRGLLGDEYLGLSDLDLRERLGEAGIGLEREGLGLQRELGFGRLDLDRLLGNRGLDLQGRGLDIERELGLGNISANRYAAELRAQADRFATEQQMRIAQLQDAMNRARLQEESRQFDYGLPLNYLNSVGGLLGSAAGFGIGGIQGLSGRLGGLGGLPRLA